MKSRWSLVGALGLNLACLMVQAAAAQGLDERPTTPGAGSRSHWSTAPRHSAGIAPDPVRHADQAIVQVYAAPTYGWRGWFAVHPWIIYKRAGETAYMRYEVIGWRAPDVVRRNEAVPDGLWYGQMPSLLVDHRGEQAADLVPEIESAIASYPYPRHYRTYPGPNSNTFLAHIARQVPALGLDLPARAIGKDYRPLTDPLGRSATGTGVQLSLWGLMGLSVGPLEGVELNLLGLHLGLDVQPLAIKLPLIGRIGASDDLR